MPATTKPEARKAMAEKMSELRAVLGSITVETNVVGANISLNGREVGTSPLTRPLFVDPGSHRLRATHSNAVAKEETIAVIAGQSAEVRIELVLNDDGLKPGVEGRPVWPMIALGGVAVAGLGVGIAGLVLEQQQLSDADDALAAIGVGGCGATGNGCSSANESLKQADMFQTMGIAGVAIAGAAGVGALIYGLLPAGSGLSRNQGVRIQPMLGRVSGAFLEGEF